MQDVLPAKEDISVRAKGSPLPLWQLMKFGMDRMLVSDAWLVIYRLDRAAIIRQPILILVSEKDNQWPSMPYRNIHCFGSKMMA